MGFFVLKTAKISDFCNFPKKKLTFEVFLPKFRDLCHEKRKSVPKALKGWYWHVGITGISHSTMALMKNGFFEFRLKSAMWRLRFSLTKNSCFLDFWKLHKIGDSCASLEHEKFGKAYIDSLLDLQ